MSIKRTTDVSTRFFWGASYGQIYPELKRLEHAGLVRGSEQAAGARRRREYRLTAKGERTLRAWLTSREPLEYSTRDEGLLKLFFASAVAPEDALATIRQRRAQHEQALAFFRTIRADGYPALALEYGIALLEWDMGWWAELEQRLSREARARRPRPAETKAARRPSARR